MTRRLTMIAAALLIAVAATATEGLGAQGGQDAAASVPPQAPATANAPAQPPRPVAPPQPAAPSAATAPEQAPTPPPVPTPPEVPPDFDGADNGAVRLGQDFTLPAGQRVREAVVIFGNATIAGEVEEDVVVILGTAHLASTATIGKNFVTIGGTATVDQGASVGHDLVVVGGGLDAAPGFTPGHEQVVIGSTMLGGRMAGLLPWLTRGLMWGRPIVPDLPWVWGIVAFFFVIYLAINALFDRHARQTAEFLREKPLTAFGTGLLVLLLIGPAFLILAISVIGIAVMPFLLCALIGAWILGKIAVARGLGGILASDEPDNRIRGALAFTIGFALLCVAYMIPVLGVVAWAVSGVFGLGAAAMMLITAYRREIPPAAVPPVVPPPVPPPVPTQEDTAVNAAGGGVAPASFAFAGAAAAGEPTVAPPLPAAVAVAFPFARFRDRLAALALDVILVMLAVRLFDPRQEGRAFFFGMLVYHVALWTWKQTTVGGIICQLRVVRIDGRPLSFADAVVRALSAIFSVAVAGLGVFWILRDPEHQSWHDKIAGTYVVKVPRNYPL